MVSVIIPTRKNEDIIRLVRSIRASAYHPIEIIVVDEGLERSQQRNLGILRAHGEYLMFCDSDWVLTPWLISNCALMMHDYDALYIPEIIKTKGFFGYLRNWERQFYTGTAIDTIKFVRASICPRFDETMSGPEDADFSRRIGGRRGTAYFPFYHFDNIGFWGYLKKKAYYCRSMARYAEKNPDDKVLDWRWRCFKVFFERQGWKRIVRRPDLMLLVWILIFFRGLIYLWNKEDENPISS